MNYILIGLLLSKQNILVAVFFMRALESMYLLVFLTYSFVPNKSVSIFCTPQALNSDKTMKMTVIDSQPLTPLLDVKHWPFGKNISDTPKSFCFNKTIDSNPLKALSFWTFVSCIRLIYEIPKKWQNTNHTGTATFNLSVNIFCNLSTIIQHNPGTQCWLNIKLRLDRKDWQIYTYQD